MSVLLEAVDVLRQRGFTLTLETPPPENPDDPAPPLRLRLEGPHAPPEELRREIVARRDEVKAALLLADPPAWLIRLLDLHASGEPRTVSRTVTSKTGKTQRAVKREVSVSIENIAAAVAAEIGISPRDLASGEGITPLVREKVLPEVEAHARSWEPGKVLPFRPSTDGQRSKPKRSGPRWSDFPDETPEYDRMVEERMASLAGAFDKERKP